MMNRKLSWILLMFMLMAVVGKKTSASVRCNPQDFVGLTSFKSGILLDTSGRLKKWIGHSCCQWEGVHCNNKTRRVTEIRLPGFISTNDFILQTEMKGQLSPSITLLTSLEVIDLGGLLSLTGSIPASIGFRLPNLRKLYLYGNKLSGNIPENIGKLSKLEEFHLHENNFSGKIPWTLGKLRNLNSLLFYTNQFSGEIPNSLTNLTNLVTLDLHGNTFTGSIPEKIGSLQALETLDLSSNHLSGKLPVSLGNLTSISVIYLDTNLLEGEITFFPSVPDQMPLLGFLRLQGNRLTGGIPLELGNLISLQRLSLANNKLKGTIPSSIGNLSALTELYLDGNQLSGQIPKTISLLSRLLSLSISNNLLEGLLPLEMSSLQNLQTLDISFNRLNLTSIPKWLGVMPSLSRFFLAGCNINGPIPDLFRTSQSPLLELDLSSNHLTGSIPPWLGDLAQLYSLNLSRNSLISNIPNTIVELVDLGILDLHSNRLIGTIDSVFKIGSRFQEGSLTYIDLSDNKFSGRIEAIGVGEQTKIQYLSLSHNYLTGKVPVSIGRLEVLESLDLSYNGLGFELPEELANVSLLERLDLQRNRFTGEIPNEFLKLRKLRELDLSDNLLVGEIPLGKPLSNFPSSSYSGNKGLCGKPLTPCKA
ncbi:hypothetical protein ACHQM5_005983 [Ranunculus cassubicifolius]